MRAGFPGVMSPALGGGFLPTNITNLQLWLDADDSGTITQSSGNVSQWDDKSGNENHGTQGTEANQPNTGTRTLNDKNVLDFNGTTDFLTLTSNVTLSDDFSIFIVNVNDSIGSVAFLLGDETFNIKIGGSGTSDLFIRVQSLGSADQTTLDYASGGNILYATRDVSDKVDAAFNKASLTRLYSDAAQTGNTIFQRISS